MKKTIQNLTKAFIGESQARNRYSMYSKVAKKEGYEQIAGIFDETADQEREHAKWLFRLINELKEGESEDLSEIEVQAGAPTILGTTAENLEAAISGEHYEYESMYPEFAKTAEEEGLPKIAARLRSIAKAEEHHEERYKKILEAMGLGNVFEKNEERVWVCRKCGFKHSGKSAPKKCPACDHPQSYYQLQCETY